MHQKVFQFHLYKINYIFTFNITKKSTFINTQLCQLLESPKSNLSNIPSTYPLLNPLQVYTALQHFQPPISPSISHLPSPDGELEESLEACPTLILPEDGFCCDSIQGLPQAFVAFAEAFEQAGRALINGRM